MLKKLICLLFHNWTKVKMNTFHGAFKYCPKCDPECKNKKYL